MDQLSRRTVLTSGLGVAGGLVLGRVFNAVAQADILDCGPDLIIQGDHVQTSHLVVPADKILKFEPGASLTLDNCSLLVYGTLEGRPGNSIKFTNVDEAGFVGGGMGPIDENDPILSSDPGLWVMGDGVLDIQGTPKVAWNRTGDDPSWSASDELVSTPIQPGDYSTFASFIKGSVVPEVSTPFGIHKAEVLNLSRDFTVEGTPTGRSHIFIRSTRPSIVKHPSIRHMGPRQVTDIDRVVVGRWPLHFHHAGDGSRLSTVEGVVVRDAGSHAFVPHASHGVSYRDCIAFDVQESPYWWDQVNDDPEAASADVLFDRCVSAKVKHGIEDKKVGGFSFGSSLGNCIVRNHVSVGVISPTDGAGYIWKGEGFKGWIVEDNLAHNCDPFGTWLYGNPAGPNPLHRFTTYNCAKAGSHHGAYKNSQEYFDLVSSGALSGLEAKAVAGAPPDVPQRFVRPKLHGTNHAIKFPSHVTFSTVPIRFEDGELKGWILVAETNGNPGAADLIRCVISTDQGSRDVEPSDWDVQQMEGVYRVQRGNGTAYRMNADGSSTEIPAFA